MINSMWVSHPIGNLQLLLLIPFDLQKNSKHYHFVKRTLFIFIVITAESYNGQYCLRLTFTFILFGSGTLFNRSLAGTFWTGIKSFDCRSICFGNRWWSLAHCSTTTFLLMCLYIMYILQNYQFELNDKMNAENSVYRPIYITNTNPIRIVFGWYRPLGMVVLRRKFKAL